MITAVTDQQGCKHDPSLISNVNYFFFFFFKLEEARVKFNRAIMDDDEVPDAVPIATGREEDEEFSEEVEQSGMASAVFYMHRFSQSRPLT